MSWKIRQLASGRRWLPAMAATLLVIGLVMSGCQESTTPIRTPSTDAYTFVRQFGTWGSEAGQFKDPQGLAVDNAGNVYVADTGNHRIQKFDSSGQFLTQWGAYGSTPISGGSYEPPGGRFDGPQGVAVDSDGYVYVADTGNNRIQKFDSTGHFLLKWGDEGAGEGQFRAPGSVAVDKDSYVYVTDTRNYRVQKFDPSGQVLAQWGSSGNNDGQFWSLKDLAVDNMANVYVVDAVEKRVQKFDSDGRFILKWGDEGYGEGKFYSPMGIGVDNTGTVYVTDWGNRREYTCRIQEFDSNGRFVVEWGSEGSEPGDILSPGHVAVDSARRVYVVDSGNDRVLMYAPAAA